MVEIIEDIYPFLPKYPNIVQDTNQLFNPYDNNFYENIYRKKEFYDEKLDVTEEFPEDVGGLLKHQKIIARFFSSRTLYDQLLLVHEMGTGKSCSAIGAIEQIKADGGFYGALYLAKGEALINNFINEIVFKCTDGRYIPENYDKLTKLEQIHRKKKNLKEFYDFSTFETFAKYIKSTSDQVLKKEYSNKIIIIDEVHNLRIQEKISGLDIYQQFIRFLHVIEGSKILLLSGTPIKDNIKELASVMNLILPYKNNNPFLSYGEEFVKEYFINKGSDLFFVKDSKKNKLKKIMKGRISYLQAMKSDVKVIYEGKKLGNLKHLIVKEDLMSDFQSKYYTKAYKMDTEGDKEGIYSNSRQASLFIFPDGTFGQEGFNNFIKTTKITKHLLDETSKKPTKTMTFSFKKELYDLLKGETVEETIQNVEKYSSKYASTLRNALTAQREGKCMFIYNEFVYGGGLILLGLLLELVGFAKASGKEKDEAPRYASLTNVTSTTPQIRDIINRFNNKDNVHGKVINIILGSKKISEGFSFQNIQIEEILSPWFNYSETSQAIARGIRLGSHKELEKYYIPTVKIYQRVSIPKGNITSIDLDMYERSENKDISIKNVERLMKESAFDCALNYTRNRVIGKDGQRECEYLDCMYNCDGIDSELLKTELEEKDLDYSTFQLYYNKDIIEEIKIKIKNIFLDTFKIDLESLYNELENYTEFDILTTIRIMINNNEKIINKYGFISYIKEDSNIYFLISNISISGSLTSEYYTEFPIINADNNFMNIINPIYYNYLPSVIEEICTCKTTEKLHKLISKLPSEIISFLIEQTLLAHKMNIKTNKETRDLLLEYFKGFYKEHNGIWYSSYLYEKEDTLRCLSNNVWVNCSEEQKEEYLLSQQANITNLEQNPYGFYGQLNPENKKFCIRDVSSEKEDKKHKRTSGRVCNPSWDLKELYDLAINQLKMEIPNDSEVEKYLITILKKKRGTKLTLPSLKDKTALWNIIKQFKIIDTMFDDKKSKLTSKDMLRILYWGTRKKQELCPFIQDWFESKGLLDLDKGCGDTRKKKI